MNAKIPFGAEYLDAKWKSISIGDAKYSICASERSGTWNVSMTNLIEIWTEELDKEKILQKCEKLNPSLSIEDIDVHQFVHKILQDIPKYTTKASVDEIKLSCQLEGGLFQFAINFTRGSNQRLWEEVTMPLCLAAGELRRRHTILLDLVKKKDAEISEYKLNGAELIRKHIKTEPFNEDVFKKNVPTQNAESCQDAFQRVMELRGDVVMERHSVKTEPTKTCPTETPNIEETSVKVEVEENSDENTIERPIHNETSPNIEDNLTREIVNEEPNVLVPKHEKNSPPKISQLPKPSKSEIEMKNSKMDTGKRTRSAPALSSKRTRKNIHDFIK